ncbi:L,D-transpeptidase family protein [Paenibacillus solisilvae]|uniref:L,D-transpeptidase family protein n=1 Tax=Paenibacillus solisilvae TaxID=2486751 RepID=A0ABW0VQQ4_9BACL
MIIVNKKTNQLAFFKDGVLVKTFSVATGKTKDLTPEGSFTIANKIKNRPYYKEKIPGGDPRNPLGDRWLGLDVNGTHGTTYAIHGNNNEKSIGKYVSAGCIRMKNEEIHWLYPQVKIDTAVIITSSALTFEAVAEKHGYLVGLDEFAGKLFLNGKLQTLEHSMLIADSRIYLPLRECFELLGARVEWSNRTQTVTATIGNRTLIHQVLTKQATVNGKTIDITASRLEHNTVMIPLRNMAELTGYSVIWDGTDNTIALNHSQK